MRSSTLSLGRSVACTLGLVSSGLFLAACGLESDDQTVNVEASSGTTTPRSIDSSKTGSAEGFYFLPPIARAPSAEMTGALAMDLAPLVRIDEIDPKSGAISRTITTLSRSKSTADGITVDANGYHAVWNTKLY